jgi:acylphosphatase
VVVERKCVRLRIEGRVQGVWYRGWTVRAASRLGLDGWVRNLPDGAVEAVLSGQDDKVQSMIKRCWNGPPAAVVDAVDAEPFEGDVPSGFRQVR